MRPPDKPRLPEYRTSSPRHPKPPEPVASSVGPHQAPRAEPGPPPGPATPPHPASYPSDPATTHHAGPYPPPAPSPEVRSSETTTSSPPPSATAPPTVVGNQFGTFGGVFTPVVLTILGVIMFMRTGYVVGYSGLWMALLILLISKTITTLTTLSLSAIATNLDVRVGGVYFMISRVLGPDFGGSIGITLFIAQAVSIAFYTIGFTEATFAVLETSMEPAFMTSLIDAHVPQIVSTVVVIGLFALTFRGAEVALKAQYVVLVVLLLSVISFLVGGVMKFDASTLVANRTPAFEPSIGFWGAFAIFFPAATGISAGANMSGDLKDPSRSIPRGTLLAIGFTAAIYTAQIVLVAGVTTRVDLQVNPFAALQDMSVFGPLIVAGVFAATLSSALGSFLGAPRILQAMGQDGLMRSLVFFGKGSGPANEPRRATILSWLIAVAVIWAGDLNAVAEIISMFFLIAYGMINLSAFVESKSLNPSFRPRFRWFHWSTGLLGALGCLVAMLKINDTYAIVAGVITAGIYYYLRTRNIQASWGDAKRGFVFQNTRDNLLYLEKSTSHPKNWRPILAALGPDPMRDARLIQVGCWLESRRGLYTVAEICETTERNMAAKLEYRKRRRSELRAQLESLDIIGFPEVVVVSDYNEGVATFLQSYAVEGLRPNTVLATIPPALDTVARQQFMITAHTLWAFDYNTVLIHGGDMALEKPQRVIDLWWRGSKNGSLMALLAHLVREHRVWRTAKLRIFRAVPHPDQEPDAHAKLDRLLANARIDAETHVFHTSEEPHQFIPSRSAGVADLVMLGLNSDDLAYFSEYMDVMEPLLAKLPTTLLVWSNGEADLFA